MPYTIPIGPFHPALEEPYKVRVRCAAETVEQVNVTVGFCCRGIELLAQRRNWVQAVTLIERVCGICSNVHTATLCRAIETVAGIEAPAYEDNEASFAELKRALAATDGNWKVIIWSLPTISFTFFS